MNFPLNLTLWGLGLSISCRLFVLGALGPAREITPPNPFNFLPLNSTATAAWPAIGSYLTSPGRDALCQNVPAGSPGTNRQPRIMNVW